MYRNWILVVVASIAAVSKDGRLCADNNSMCIKYFAIDLELDVIKISTFEGLIRAHVYRDRWFEEVIIVMLDLMNHFQFEISCDEILVFHYHAS